MSRGSTGFLNTVAAQSTDAAIWTSIMSVGGGLGEIFVNHSARMLISHEHALPQLLAAYERSKYLTNSILLVSGVSAISAYYQKKDRNWLIGALLMFGGIPMSVFVERAIVDQLRFLLLDARAEKAAGLLSAWGRVQFGKLALAMAGATIFYWFTRR